MFLMTTGSEIELRIREMPSFIKRFLTWPAQISPSGHNGANVCEYNNNEKQTNKMVCLQKDGALNNFFNRFSSSKKTYIANENQLWLCFANENQLWTC